MVVLDARTAQIFTTTIRQFQRDIHREWHTDTFQCWRVDRGPGWADSASVEAKEKIQADTGKLYKSGEGSTAPGLVVEGVLSLESPYRFSTEAISLIEPGHLLVVNVNEANPDLTAPRSTHLFRVDDAKRNSSELMDAYLTELFTTPMPGMS